MDMVDASGAQFDGTTSFADAVFERFVWFDGAKFLDTVIFDRTVFKDDFSWNGNSFNGIQAYDAAFEGSVSAQAATLRSAVFVRAMFKSILNLSGSTLAASFLDRPFEKVTVHGLARVEHLSMRKSVFLEHVTIELSGGRVFLSKMQFRRGASIRLSGSEIGLEEAEFGAPSIVSSVGEAARVLSLRDTDLANLVIADADLAACRLDGARNLDRLRIEGGASFANATRGTQRQALAEELEWRFTRPRRTHWYPTASQMPEWIKREGRSWGLREARPLIPRQLASLYRELRKGREDASDAPGAADFYYGEMEMRRHDESSPIAERAIIWLYWLTSGYGLRAS